MKLRDHIHALVSKQILHRFDQDRSALQAVADEVIAAGTEQRPGCARDMVVVNVKRFLSAVVAGGRALADSALAVLGGEHAVVVRQRDAVGVFKISGFLSPRLRDSQMILLRLKHILHGISANYGCARSGVKVLFAKREMLLHLASVEVFGAKLARLENPASRAKMGLQSECPLSGFKFLGMQSGIFRIAQLTAAIVTSRLTGGSRELPHRFDLLTDGADEFPIAQLGSHRAVFQEMAKKGLPADHKETEGALNVPGMLHRAFSCAASSISLLTAPEADVSQDSASFSSLSLVCGLTRTMMISVFGLILSVMRVLSFTRNTAGCQYTGSTFQLKGAFWSVD